MHSGVSGFPVKYFGPYRNRIWLNYGHRIHVKGDFAQYTSWVQNAPAALHDGTFSPGSNARSIEFEPGSVRPTWIFMNRIIAEEWN